MRKPAAAAALVLLLTALPVEGQTAATAAGYPYPVKVEDPAGDQTVGPGPGAANEENDILSLELTDDAAGLVARIALATLAFTVPAGTVTLTLQLTGPGGEDWEVTVIYESDGGALTVDDFDPGTGDPDELMPGARAEVDAASGHVYVFGANSDTGAALGDVITIDSLSSGRGTAAGSFSNFDTVPDAGGVEYTYAAPAAPPPSATSTSSASPSTSSSTSSSTSATSTSQRPTSSTTAPPTTGGFPLQEEETPGLGLVALAALMGLAALAVRRRLG